MPFGSIKKAYFDGFSSAARAVTETFSTTKDAVSERVDKGKSNFTDGWNDATKSIVARAKRVRNSQLVFPRDMLVESKRPYIRFTCKPANGGEAMTSVNLPCPGGVSFSDGGSYTTIDMGMIGDIAQIVAKGGSATEMAGAALGTFKKQAAGLGAVGGGILALKTLGANDAATALEFANKSIRNPRTNTAFSGNTLRNFQFNFKMIGKDPKEVDEINEIQSFFREQVYASKLNGTSTIMQQYPNQWTIQFMDPRDGTELQYMPKIFTSYLTSATTAVNSTTNTYRTDLSPLEVDVSLGFQETKILDRDEINALEAGIRFNRDDDAYNQLTSDAQTAVEGVSGQLQGKLDSARSAAAEAAKRQAKEAEEANKNNTE